jgi:hypothetical protein
MRCSRIAFVVAVVTAGFAGSAEAGADGGDYGYYNESRGVWEIYYYNDSTGTLTYVSDCGSDPRCAYTDTQSQNGQCSYLNPLTLSSDWRQLGTIYTGLGACASEDVTVVAGVGRVTFRGSVREALTSATYSVFTQCSWKDAAGAVLLNCNRLIDPLCTGNGVIANCDSGVQSTAAGKPIGGVTFCGRSQVQKGDQVYRRTAEICITP